LREQPILEEIGKKYGKTASQVALRWLVQQHNVAAIPKASSEKNLRLNFEIFDFTLSEDDLRKTNTLQGNNRFNSFDFSPVWDK
jgi:2,5-diketo-D-gluconate reductase B